MKDRKSDMEEVMDTAQQLPAQMWERELTEECMDHPVFDGEKVVEGGS